MASGSTSSSSEDEVRQDAAVKYVLNAGLEEDRAIREMLYRTRLHEMVTKKQLERVEVFPTDKKCLFCQATGNN